VPASYSKKREPLRPSKTWGSLVAALQRKPSLDILSGESHLHRQPGTSKDRSMPTHRKRPRDFSHAGVLVFDMLCIKKKNLSGNPVLRKKIGRPNLSLLAPCNGHETGAYGNGREAEDHWHQHDCPKHRCSSLLRISPTSGATGAGHRRHLARSRGPVLCQSPQAKPSLRSAPPHLE
jgi:hypothetical protein